MISKGSFGDELLVLLQLLPVTTVLSRATDGVVTWVNPAHVALVAADDASQVIGMTILDFLPEEEQAIALRDMGRFAEGADYVPPVVYTLQRLDGTSVKVHIETVPLTFHDEPTLLSLVVDVSDREDALAALAESELRYRSLVETSPDAIIVAVGEEIVYANPSAYALLLADSPEEVLGKSPLDFVAPEMRELSRGRFARVYSTATPLPIVESVVQRRDGTRVPVELRTTLISWRGEPATQSAVHDISARKATENELREHREHLEQLVEERTTELERTVKEMEEMNRDLLKANAAKSSFMAAMSHELRTPLNSVIGFSSILQKGLAGELNEEQAKQIGMINSSGRQLLALVGNVLDLERIESGRTEITLREFSPHDMAYKLVEMVKPLAEGKRLRVRCTVSSHLPRTIRTDQMKVEQILMNLLANAIKYSEEGTVALDVCADRHAIRFAVSDTGPGVEPEQRDRIFDEFYQISTRADVAKPVGAGLGLAIAKRLAEMLGANLWLESEVAVGSVFILELPLG